MVELLAVLGVLAILGGVSVAQVLASLEHSRGYAAAKYLGSRFSAARIQAVSRGAAIAFRFDENENGVTFAMFQDGNGDGVRTTDIQSGVDSLIEPAATVSESFPGADIGLTPTSPVTDPVQIGSTNLLTFTPLGTATSGTVYISDREGTQWAVRILGATGRTRVLRYDARARAWLVAQ